MEFLRICLVMRRSGVRISSQAPEVPVRSTCSCSYPEQRTAVPTIEPKKPFAVVPATISTDASVAKGVAIPLLGLGPDQPAPQSPSPRIQVGARETR